MLVADDSAVNREVAIEALTRLGARVKTVDNGAEAVTAAATGWCDIILMDGSMPELDGFQAARIVRDAEAAERRTRVPIVAVTAHVVGAMAEEWRSAGMDAVVHKPFTIAQIAQCLLQLVPQFQTPEDQSAQMTETSATEADAGAGAEASLMDAAVMDRLRAPGESQAGDFFTRVVKLYREHAPKACSQLAQHAIAGEAEACGAVAHLLKSMSLNIGASGVATIADRFEQMARRDQRRA